MLNLFLIAFLDILGFGVIVPLLPFFMDIYKLTEVGIGLLASSYFVAAIVGSFATGYLSDIFGRKIVLIASLIGLIVGYLGLALIQNIPHLFALFITLRMFSGFCAGNIAVVFASVANLSNEHNMLKNMSILSIALTSGFILGPIIGGILVTINSIILPFYVAAFSYLICLLVTIFLFKEPTYKKDSIKQSLIMSLKKILSDKGIILFIILFVLVSFSIATVEVFFLTYILSDKLALNTLMLGLIWTYLAFIATIVQIFSYKFIKPSFAITFGFILWGTGIFVLIFVNSITFAFISTTFMGLGLGLLFPNLSSHLALSGSDKQQGTIFGITLAAESLGGAIGPMALGYILFITGSLNFIWITLSVLCLLATLSATIYYYKQKKVLN